jgi:translation initiation factor 2 subunit 1
MEAVEELPEEGEIVVASVMRITPHGVYVSLDEYGGMPGFLHVSEISTGWIRNIERHIRPGQKLVLKVIRVSRARQEVDLSLRQVSGEERKRKLIEVKREEKARSILQVIKHRLGLSDTEVEGIADAILERYPTLYEALEEIVRHGDKALEGVELPDQTREVLVEVVKERIALPMVEITGVIECTIPTPKGVDQLKRALQAAEEVKVPGVKAKITYLGAPRYRLVVEAEEFKTAERGLSEAIKKAQKLVTKAGGFFKFTRGESRRKPVK